MLNEQTPWKIIQNIARNKTGKFSVSTAGVEIQNKFCKISYIFTGN